LRFSLNEPVTLVLAAGGKRYTRVLRAPKSTQFWFKVMPAAYTLRATDASGNTTAVRYRR
jgi:hypothetical protein